MRERLERLGGAVLLAVGFMLGGCASGDQGPPPREGWIGVGGHLTASGSSSTGPSWSLNVEAGQTTLEFEGCRVILEERGTQKGLSFQERHGEPPHYTLLYPELPPVVWQGRLLQIGETTYTLRERGLYRIDGRGEVRFEAMPDGQDDSR